VFQFNGQRGRLIILFRKRRYHEPEGSRVYNSDIFFYQSHHFFSTTLTYPEHYNVFENRLCALSRCYLPRCSKRSTAAGSTEWSWWYVLLGFMQIEHMTNQTNVVVNANVDVKHVDVLSNEA